MDILFLSTEIPFPPNGGHSIRTYNILKILSQKHKIYFIGFAQTNNDLKYIKNMKKLCEEVYVRIIPKTGYNLKFFSIATKNIISILPLMVQRYYVQKVGRDIQNILAERNIDLVHIDMLALASYREYMHDIPTILTNHNVEHLRLYRWIKIERNLPLKFFLFLQYLKLKNYEIKMCPLFNNCIVVSENDKFHLCTLCALKKVSVIPNGVDINFYKPLSINTKSNHLIWVGGMARFYSADAVDYFLDRIWPNVKQEIPEVSIDFIGKAPTKKLIKKAASDPNIKILGFVDDIRPFVQRAAVFVAPIRSGSGTKIKVLNAMAQAKTVVATNIAAEGIDATHSENIIIAENAADFSEKIIYLLKNKRKAEEIGRKARVLIEKKYSWEVIGRQVENLYEKYE